MAYRICVAVDIDAGSAEEAYKKLYEGLYEVDREDFSWESTDEWYDPDGGMVDDETVQNIRMKVINELNKED